MRLSELFHRLSGYWIYPCIVALAVSLLGAYSPSMKALKFKSDGVITNAIVVKSSFQRLSAQTLSVSTTLTYNIKHDASKRNKTVTTQTQHIQFSPFDINQTIPIRYLQASDHQFEIPVGFYENRASKWLRPAAVISIICLIIHQFAGFQAINGFRARRMGRQITASVDDVCSSWTDVNLHPLSRFQKGQRIYWQDELGNAGYSWLRRPHDLGHLKKGAEIKLFLHNGRTFWDGDVGARATNDRKIPKSGTPYWRKRRNKPPKEY